MVSSKIFELKSKFVENAKKRSESEKRQREFEEKKLHEFLLNNDYSESIFEKRLKPYCEELSTSFLDDISKLQKIECSFGKKPSYLGYEDSGVKNSFFELKFFYEKGKSISDPINVREVSYEISIDPSRTYGEITAYLYLSSYVTFFEESKGHRYYKNFGEIREHTNLTVYMDDLFFNIFEFHSNVENNLEKKHFQTFMFKKMGMNV